jgi:hypothetical protein
MGQFTSLWHVLGVITKSVLNSKKGRILFASVVCEEKNTKSRGSSTLSSIITWRGYTSPCTCSPHLGWWTPLGWVVPSSIRGAQALWLQSVRRIWCLLGSRMRRCVANALGWHLVDSTYRPSVFIWRTVLVKLSLRACTWTTRGITLLTCGSGAAKSSRGCGVFTPRVPKCPDHEDYVSGCIYLTPIYFFVSRSYFLYRSTLYVTKYTSKEKLCCLSFKFLPFVYSFDDCLIFFK